MEKVIKVSILPSDLEGSDPLTRAIQRAKPSYGIYIYEDKCLLVEGDEPITGWLSLFYVDTYMYQLPVETLNFMSDCENGFYIEPFAFEMTLKEE